MTSKARIGMVTIGQAPRADVVPDMAALLPGVEIVEAGALDGLDRTAIASLAPDGDDAAVASLSPYEEHDPAALGRAAAALREAGAGLVVMDCIGFRDVTRRDLAARLGVPVLVANLLVARLAAELLAL